MYVCSIENLGWSPIPVETHQYHTRVQLTISFLEANLNRRIIARLIHAHHVPSKFSQPIFHHKHWK